MQGTNKKEDAMSTRQHLNRLVWAALGALVNGAASDLGTRLFDLITWRLTNH